MFRHTGGRAVYLDRADPEEQYISEGSARRASSDDPSCKYFERYYVDSAETAAVSRALSRAGFDLPGCNQVVNGFLINPLTGESVTDIQIGMLAGQAPQSKPLDPPQKESACPPRPYSPLTAPAAGQPIQAPAASRPQPVAPCQQANNQMPPQVTDATDVDDKTKLENAKNVTIPRGQYAGRTLGEIAQNDPRLLNWFATKYLSNDTTIREAAQFLIIRALTTPEAS